MSIAHKLSRRERQIMDVLYQLEEASVQQVQERLPDPPGYSAVRALLARLEEKGQITHREQGARYLYAPLVKRQTATRNALTAMVKTFFNGSPAQAANALLGMSLKNLREEELDELEALIRQARSKDRERNRRS